MMYLDAPNTQSTLFLSIHIDPGTLHATLVSADSQVNVFCDCPLWPDDSMCAMQACSVCECDANEVPSSWLAQEQGSCSTASPLAAADANSEEGQGSSAAPCTSAQCEPGIGLVQGKTGMRVVLGSSCLCS